MTLAATLSTRNVPSYDGSLTLDMVNPSPTVSPVGVLVVIVTVPLDRDMPVIVNNVGSARVSVRAGYGMVEESTFWWRPELTVTSTVPPLGAPKNTSDVFEVGAVDCRPLRNDDVGSL
jgi:hypothetical protein